MATSQLVRLDPGHGGSPPDGDPGACANGLRESDVVLEVSQLVSAMVRMGGVHVQLTRVRDVRLDEKYRSRALCQPGASCVVSVHANAAVKEDGVTQDPGPRGHEVFVSAFSEESRRLGECISDSLTARLPIPPRTPAVRTRLTDDGRDWYYVIRDPVGVGIPSVLVEIGFITNAQDAQYLSTFWGRFSAAYAVARGVLQFLGLDPDQRIADLERELASVNRELASVTLNLASVSLDLVDARNRLTQIQRIAKGGDIK